MTGSDAQLAAALSGSNFTDAAKIVRYNTNLWTTEDVAAFSNMVSTAVRTGCTVHPVRRAVKSFIANRGTSGAMFMNRVNGGEVHQIRGLLHISIGVNLKQIIG